MLNDWIYHVLRREAEGLILPDLPAFLAGTVGIGRKHVAASQIKEEKAPGSVLVRSRRHACDAVQS
jgi:hypothetical protein